MTASLRSLGFMLCAVLIAVLVSGCGSEGRQDDPLAQHETLYANWLSSNCTYLAQLPEEAILHREFTRFGDGDRTYPMFEYSVRANRPDALFSMSYAIETDDSHRPLRLSSQMYGINFILLSSRTTGKGPYGEMENQYLGVDLPSKDLTNIVTRLLAGDKFSDLVERAQRENHIIRSSVVTYDEWKDL
jgi:hypothetical protein